MVLGTPAFLAPELVSAKGTFDRRADLYALGCVAFWLLTARTPFEAGDAMTLLQHHSTTAPLAPSQISAEEIPPDMDALVLECLSKDPARRPASADVLWERLNSVRLTERWDQRRARAWWEQHEPALA
jgi:serine/threonine-protein kinase